MSTVSTLASTASNTSPSPQGQTVLLEAEYSASLRTEITLPAGVSWSNVERYFVEWNTVFVHLTDGSILPVNFDYTGVGPVDIKCPYRTSILDPDTEEELDSMCLLNA